MKRKEIGKSVLSGLAGTAIMTVFTRFVAGLRKDQLHVPAILGTILSGKKRAGGKATGDPLALFAGAAAHFSVGILFAIAYRFLWEKGILRPELRNEPVLGILNGAVGILIWNVTLKISPKSRKPDVPLKEYFPVLLAGHVLFATVTSEVYKLLEKR